MKKRYHYLAVVFLVGVLGMYGCPKKTEVTSAPEATAEAAKPAPKEETVQTGSAKSAEPSMSAEAAGQTPETGVSAEGLKSIYFDFDKFLIRDDQKEALRADAAWLKAHHSAKIKIEGNCDERGTREYNQALGQRRAVSAKKYLVALGVSESRIALISYGKEKPVCTESTESCWQKNRRDDFVVTRK